MAIINLPGVTPSIGDLNNTTPIGISQLGTPLFDDVTFLAGSYIDEETSEPITYDEVNLESVQIVVNQSKNIVKSSVAGRNGTIKEYVSLGDYEVSITAKVTELLNVFPFDQLERFQGLKNSPEAVVCICRVLNEIFEVSEFVIEDMQVSTIPGSINEVDLRINMSSDDDINFDEFLV